jgi:hypothetical protein
VLTSNVAYANMVTVIKNNIKGAFKMLKNKNSKDKLVRSLHLAVSLTMIEVGRNLVVDNDYILGAIILLAATEILVNRVLK